METAAVVALAAVSALFIGRTMLRNLGVGRPNGKPDCGCGSCTTRRGKRSLRSISRRGAEKDA
ncbi:MAG: hypothetical protein ACO1SV_07355 [Fimbriimonas sp.]